MMYLVWGCLIQQALCRENLPTVESNHDSRTKWDEKEVSEITTMVLVLLSILC
jgi:hypothetical protein